MPQKRSTAVLRREQAQAVVEACRRLLLERFGARRVIPFGSVMGDGPWHERSDVDLAVEGIPPEQFFTALSAVQDLAPPSLRVDLVDLETAPPELRARILKAVPMPEDPLLALKGVVEDELRSLERSAKEGADLLRARADPPTRTELRAMASLVHEFYTGVESIFRHLAVRLGEGLPRGEYWHVDLLNQIATAREGGRPAVIDEPLRAQLRAYLDFRHFFRRAYGYQLEWVRLRPLMEGMAGVLEALKGQLKTFFERVSP